VNIDSINALSLSIGVPAPANLVGRQ